MSKAKRTLPADREQTLSQSPLTREQRLSSKTVAHSDTATGQTPTGATPNCSDQTETKIKAQVQPAKPAAPRKQINTSVTATSATTSTASAGTTTTEKSLKLRPIQQITPAAPAPKAARAAAFFDLDKTILATSSSYALTQPFAETGRFSWKQRVMATAVQLPYLWRGADQARTEEMGKRLAQMVKGMAAHELEALVEEALTSFITPVCYTEALDLIDVHRGAGQRIVVASASIEQVVSPIARLIRADYVCASRLSQIDGRFIGDIELYLYGQEKTRAITELAQKQGWDLQECSAYTDSIVDLPMLEAVGHPVCVNPDRALRMIARERNWPILSFRKTVAPKSHIIPILAGSGVGVGALIAGSIWLWRRYQANTLGR